MMMRITLTYSHLPLNNNNLLILVLFAKVNALISIKRFASGNMFVANVQITYINILFTLSNNPTATEVTLPYNFQLFFQ